MAHSVRDSMASTRRDERSARERNARLSEPVGPGGQCHEEVADLLPGVLIGEIALAIEPVTGEVDEHLGQRQNEPVRVCQAIAEMRLGSGSPAATRARAHDRHGLAREDRPSGRPRCPVDGVLEHPGNAVVVLRGRDEQCIGGADGLLEIRDGRRVSVPTKAWQILLMLVEAGGRLVRHEEFRAQLWPSVVVEDRTLTVHMSTLRKALGSSDFIETVSRTLSQMVRDGLIRLAATGRTIVLSKRTGLQALNG